MGTDLPVFLFVARVVEFSAHALLCLVHAFEFALEFGLEFLARLCELEDVLLGGGELGLQGGASGAVVRDRSLVRWECRAAHGSHGCERCSLNRGGRDTHGSSSSPGILSVAPGCNSRQQLQHARTRLPSTAVHEPLGSDKSQRRRQVIAASPQPLPRPTLLLALQIGLDFWYSGEHALAVRRLARPFSATIATGLKSATATVAQSARLTTTATRPGRPESASSPSAFRRKTLTLTLRIRHRCIDVPREENNSPHLDPGRPSASTSPSSRRHRLSSTRFPHQGP